MRVEPTRCVKCDAVFISRLSRQTRINSSQESPWFVTPPVERDVQCDRKWFQLTCSNWCHSKTCRGITFAACCSTSHKTLTLQIKLCDCRTSLNTIGLLAQGAIGYSSVSREGSSLSVPSSYVSAKSLQKRCTCVCRVILYVPVRGSVGAGGRHPPRTRFLHLTSSPDADSPHPAPRYLHGVTLSSSHQMYKERGSLRKFSCHRHLCRQNALFFYSCHLLIVFFVSIQLARSMIVSICYGCSL